MAPSILIVDDEIIIARELELRLGRLGYEVRGIASSGEEAIGLIEEKRPSLVLMDIVLKGQMDGIEAAAEIRRRWSLPIIYLSAYADDATLKRAQITEPFGYLVKPFSERELRANIEMALYKHKAETKLRGLKKWFAASMERVTDGVVATDEEGIVTFVNREAEIITSRKSSETVGRKLQDIFPLSYGSDRSRIDELIGNALAEGIVVLREEDAFSFARNGSRFRVDVTASRLESDDGKPMGAVVVLRDQSVCDVMRETIQQREEDLRRKNEELAQLNRRKDEFLAMLAHELRNPLVPIRNLIATLRRLPLVDKPFVNKVCATIDAQVDHLVDLLDELLDVARITRGGLTVRKENCDLVEIVQQVMQAHGPLLEAHGLNVIMRLPDHPLWVQVDRTRLIQVVGNLLHNARKFTPSGGTVEVAVASTPGQAMLTVRDTGIGIAPDLLPHVFEPFRQIAQAPDRSAGGLGLGLTLVKHIVDLHGGEAKAESAGLGKGATLTVRLPLESIAILPDRAIDEVALPAPQSQRVLLIEDNTDVAESTRLLVETMGCSAQIAQDGEKGLAAARAFQPDIVLCDIGLPGAMDGYAVARAFRQDTLLSSACLVALSGYSGEEVAEKCRAAGFDLQMKKPLDAAILERILRSCSCDEQAPSGG